TAPVLVADCCNIGVVFRVLLVVNAIVLGVVTLQSARFAQALNAFVEASVVVELATLWSLFALCVLRRVLLVAQRRGYRMEAWLQRTLCVLLPAATTAVIVRALGASDIFQAGFGELTAAKSAIVAALLGLVFQHYFELRAKAFSPALVEARLQALQARIRPHFLFNSLNAVLSLIRSEPQRAESTLEDLAELFRVLMSDPRTMSSLEEELRLCRQYLAIEQIRLGERLQVDWQFDNVSEQQLRRAQVPVLLLQPLLENAVRYGVEPTSASTPVRVRIGRLLDRIEIAVTNAWLPGRDDSPIHPSGNQMALSNIRERLALLYDLEGQLATAVEDGRFEVRMSFPYQTSAA
ncbi:MAG TPA: sensor histidine kinase, partial [Noviherbaspirillum sp.]